MIKEQILLKELGATWAGTTWYGSRMFWMKGWQGSRRLAWRSSYKVIMPTGPNVIWYSQSENLKLTWELILFLESKDISTGHHWGCARQTKRIGVHSNQPIDHHGAPPRRKKSQPLRGREKLHPPKRTPKNLGVKKHDLLNGSRLWTKSFQ